MIKIVKNIGQCEKLTGKYIIYWPNKDFGDRAVFYAELGIKPIIGYILYQIRFRGYAGLVKAGKWILKTES